MAEQLVRFNVKYRSDIHADRVNAFENIKSFFLKCKKSSGKPDVLVEQFELVKQDVVYDSDLYRVPITLAYQGIVPKKVCELRDELCSKWCGEREIDLKSYWLVPEHDRYFRTKAGFHYDIQTEEISFGTLPDMYRFVRHYHYKSNGKELCSSFYHTKKLFALFMTLDHRKPCAGPSHKFLIEYNSMERVLIDDAPQTPFIEVLFQLSHPPFVFSELITDNPDDDDGESSVSCHESFQNKRWVRSLQFGCDCKRASTQIRKIGRTPVLKLKFPGKFRVRDIIDRLRHRCPRTTEFVYMSNLETYSPSPDLLRNTYEKIVFSNSVPNDPKIFSCNYSWRMLFSRSLELQDQILLPHYIMPSAIYTDHWSFIKNDLMKYVLEDPEALSNALVHISELLTRNVLFTFQSALKQLFLHFKNMKRNELPRGMCYVRRIIITPSRLVFLPETESFDNRVIRQFENANEYMIRVLIKNDDLKKLTYAVQYDPGRDYFMDRIVGDVLRQGITIVNRHYEVLASSGSQLREHGIWLYARDSNDRSAEDIRRWMGDFSQIKNVAKYMARMGQCFSTSDEAIQVTILQEEEIRIADIKTKDELYTFSDGIGKISTELAEKVRKAKEEEKPEGFTTEIEEPSYKPSAFQIRYKGCKGMLAEDPNFRRFNLGIRPSMEKFKCESSNNLEIVKLSAPRQLFLNRPLITILEQLGVKPDIFMSMQREMILELTECLLYEDKAVNLLKLQTSLNMPFKRLRDCGIFLTKEPFFRSMLLAVYNHSVNKLKTKARIAVPPMFGRNMLGVLDETKTLNYGEVFVQYSEELGYNVSKTHILEGIIVVTKNPCMHPGDVRKLRAVDVEALHHIKDCVVFPAKGKRPHPDEMAGSDLDGDEYVVIWMKDLIFPAANFAPMHYPAHRERAPTDNIGVNEMVDFLCEYIQNDNIGTFAFSHLSWADQLENGIFSDLCIQIAGKYPHVLDFAKTGKTVRLTREERPKSYPDFMEKGFVSNTYRSRRVLGHLYRFVKNLEACIDRVGFTGQKIIKPDECLIYPGWERYMESATKHKVEYVERVHALLQKYGIKTEAEAITGHVEYIKLEAQSRNECEDAILIVKTYLIKYMERYKYTFLREVENEANDFRLNNDEKQRRKLQRASAWYMATYGDGLNDHGILSMPWSLGDILVEVRKECCWSQQIPTEPVDSSLICSLDYFLVSSKFHSFQNGDASTCLCVTIAENVISQWMVCSKLNISMSASGYPCSACFNRIFDHFLSESKKKCCGATDDGCICEVYCSPMKFVLEIMKFYLSNATSLGTCSGNCEGFRDCNLQNVALKTYAAFIISRNASYFGITDNEERLLDQDDVVEGNPVRVEVSGDLYNLIYDHLPQVKEILKNETGVKEIEINIERERQSNEYYYMLVSATGNGGQRWDLEELVLDPSLIEMLKRQLAGTGKQVAVH